MAFYAGLMGNQAGQATGRVDAYKDALKREADLEQLNEQKREFDAAQTRQTNIDKIATDKAASDAVQAAANKKFEGGLQLPKGYTSYTPSQKIAYLQVRYNNAMKVGDDTAAKETLDLINSLTLGDTREANAAYTGGAKTQLTYSEIDYKRAQTRAELDLPARARQIASGHDQASIQRASMEIASRTELAHYNANVRVGIAQIAAAYHQDGLSETDALKRSIAEYEGQVKQYLQQTNPKNQILSGQDPSTVTQPAAPSLNVMPQAPVNVNVYTVDPTTGRVVKANGANNGGGGGAGGNGGGNNSATAQRQAQLSSEVKKLQSAGYDLNGPKGPQARAALKQDGFSDVEINNIARQQSQPAASSKPAPLPVPGVPNSGQWWNLGGAAGGAPSRPF